MSIIEERLAKYNDVIGANPKLKNQIVLSGGKGVVVVGGKKHECELLEGYARFPGDKYVERIDSQDIAICILPKRRLLVARNNKWYMGGYKKGNSSDCFLVVHAVTEAEEVFLVWIADEEIPISIMIGDNELAEESVGTMMMKVFQYMMSNSNSNKLDIRVPLDDGGDADEFE